MPTRRANMRKDRRELRIVASACLLATIASPLHAAESTAATLQRSTQALLEAVAPGERAVWEHYSDPAFSYVTEDNEVKTRAQVLEDLKPLPPGSTGWILVEEFRCTDFGTFAVTTYVMNEHETVEGHELRARYRGSDTWRRTAGGVRLAAGGWRLVTAQVYAIPQDPPRADVPAGRLADYEGLHGLSPATRQTIRSEGDHLVVERAGRQPQADLVWTRLAPQAAR